MYSAQRQSRTLNATPRPRGRITATECSSVSVADLPTTLVSCGDSSILTRKRASALAGSRRDPPLRTQDNRIYPCQNPASHRLSPPTSV